MKSDKLIDDSNMKNYIFLILFYMACSQARVCVNEICVNDEIKDVNFPSIYDDNAGSPLNTIDLISVPKEMSVVSSLPSLLSIKTDELGPYRLDATNPGKWPMTT